MVFIVLLLLLLLIKIDKFFEISNDAWTTPKKTMMQKNRYIFCNIDENFCLKTSFYEIYKKVQSENYQY